MKEAKLNQYYFHYSAGRRCDQSGAGRLQDQTAGEEQGLNVNDGADENIMDRDVDDLCAAFVIRVLV